MIKLTSVVWCVSVMLIIVLNKSLIIGVNYSHFLHVSLLFILLLMFMVLLSTFYHFIVNICCACHCLVGYAMLWMVYHILAKRFTKGVKFGNAKRKSWNIFITGLQLITLIDAKWILAILGIGPILAGW